MPETSYLDKVFTKAFANQQEGHAIYPPVSTKNIKPGTCGYFDRSGNWHKIAQLTNVEEVKQLLGDKVVPLDPTVQPEVEDDIETKWSAKASKNVNGQAIEIGAGAAPPGSPAGASAGWEYVCETSSGAVILVPNTESIITTGLNNAYKMRDWVHKHVKEIVRCSDYKTISKKGLWMITKTYAAPRRAVTVMTANGHKASFHLAAKVHDAGKAKASAAWWDSDQSSSGWSQSKAKEEGEGVILFIQGIWWRSGGFLEKSWVQEEEKKHQVLGEGDKRDPIYIDLPRQEHSSMDDADMTLLELYAQAVGIDVDLEDLPVCNDSYSVYENDGE